MKKILIIALVVAFVTISGAFAYTYTTTTGTIGIAEPTEDVATCNNATAAQPDWDSVLVDLASENKTCGEVPTGDLFNIIPNAAYTGDLVTNVCMANTAELTKAYSYLNIKLYLEGSAEADQTPNYRLLTLKNGEASFALEDLEPVSGTWTQTSEADFDGGTLYQVDAISPGDVILDTFTDNVTDTFDDETKIAASVNVTVAGGQVKLTTTGGPGTETLRPNAAGDETNIASQSPSEGAHWDKVDEAVADNTTTYVYNSATNYERDLYNMPDHSEGSGNISAITVYTRVYWAGNANPNQNWAKIAVKSGSTVDEYEITDMPTRQIWYDRSHEWDANPDTGNAWTWDEIDSLQIGVAIREAYAGGPANAYCTQVYVEVDYAGSYDSPGTLTSVNLLSGETVKSIDSFYYDASAIPSGTGLKVQFSQDNTNWYNSSGTLGGWDTLSQGTDSIDLSGLGWSGPNFYYKMEFTSDGTDTPVLDEIRVNFSSYYTSGTLTSSAYDTGYDADWEWGTISFTIDEPSTTDIVFQIRTASTEGGLGLAAWYGPTGTGDNYSTSGTAINSVHDGDRWIQYKAYFSGPGTSTPTLSDVAITYTAEAISFTIEVIGGSYCLVSDNTSEWGEGWTVTPEFYCEATQR